MPLLIPDLAHTFAESNRRATVSVVEGIVEALRGRVDKLRQLDSEWDTLRRRTSRAAVLSTLALMCQQQL